MKKLKYFTFKTKLMLINSSIYVKIILSFSLIIIFFSIVFYMDFMYYKNDKITNTLNTISQMNAQSLSEMDSYITDIEKLTEMPLFQKNPNMIKRLKESNYDNDVFLKLDDDLNYIFDIIFSLKNDIYSVFMFNLNGKSSYKISGASLYSNYYPYDEQWFQDTIKNFGKPLLVPSYKYDYLDDKPNGLNYFFTISRALVDYNTSSVAGVITINTSINVLKEYINPLLIYDNQRILLVDSYNNIIYDTVEENISKPISDIDISLDLNNGRSNHLKINGEDFVIKINTSDYTKWKLVNLIPSSSLNKQLTSIKENSILFILFFTLGALVLISILSRQIVQPIQLLSKKMALVEKGDLDISLNVSTTDEIGRLSSSFNKMVQKLKELINEVYIDKIKQKETEIKMLQNQINPHFLYNTLESIHMMAEINDDLEVSDMSIALGNILRYGLSSRISIVTLEDEIKNIQLYMNLQKNRLDNIDDIYFEIDNYLLNAKVIKLILQPIVENSIYHGLSSIAKGGGITVKAYEEDKNLIIDIIDNGNGINEETLNKLNGYINGFNDEFSSIGLKNVHTRIQLHYGSEYGLHIFSTAGNGTLVKLKIPLKFE